MGQALNAMYVPRRLHSPVWNLASCNCLRVLFVQERRHLLAQGFVTLIMMARDHGSLEERALDILGQRRPCLDDRGAERKCISIVHAECPGVGFEIFFSC